MADPGFIFDQNIKTTPRTMASEVEFQASQVIERLEVAAEKAANEATNGSPGGQAWKNPHNFLPLPSKSTTEILRILEDLMTYEESSSLTEWAATAGAPNPDEEDNTPPTPPPPAPACFPVLNNTAKFALSTFSLTGLGVMLDRTHCQQLNSRLTIDCTRWLNHLFRFYDSSALFHEDPLEGVVRVTRFMLHYKYPKYQEEGFEAISAEPPVIYSSMASPLGVVQHLCRQLGLPLRCVHPVPCNTLFGSQQKMDISELERLIEMDKANKRTPLIVLADAGTIIAGHVDNLVRLQEVCEKNDIWLHLRGHNLAALALSPPLPSSLLRSPKLADSLTLPVGNWLGIPSLPIVTLYRPCRSSSSNVAANARESTLPLVAGLMSDSAARRLTCLPMWATLQTLGQDGIQLRIKRAFESSEMVWKAVSKFPCLSLLSQRPGGEAGTLTVAEVTTKPVNTTMLLEVVASTVVFQFVQDETKGVDVETNKRAPPYYDKLNTWLGHNLQQECPQVDINLCEMDSYGIVLRFCPLEVSTEGIPTREDVDIFTKCLEMQLEILTATVQLKEVFQQSVANCPNLELVQDMADWAGLGGVRYVPEGWELLQPDQRREELNRLNIQLLDRLQSTDQAFSLGEDSEGMAYIRFGMVTAGSDVEELLELVLTVGKEVEESSRFLETMTQVVKKGIETATLDLQKENEERLWQEGILRQVPVVGSFVNWWSPRTKESGIKGRSLNLNAGVVESTENIYRYHMQLEGNNAGGGSQGSRVTPTPMVQTPVGAVAGSQHSRSSSQTSQMSQSTLSNSVQPTSPVPPSALLPHTNAASIPNVNSASVSQIPQTQLTSGTQVPNNTSAAIPAPGSLSTTTLNTPTTVPTT